MVRLFVPEGEGQHTLVRRHPDPVATNAQIATVPIQTIVLSTAFTAFAALVGTSRPGLFLKATAYVSAASISATSLQLYGQREVDSAVLKLDNVDPKLGQLWERTKHWTVEDMVVGGGIFGTLLALNPRALPGVGGWKRYLGAATVGSALGGFVGETRLVRYPRELRSMMRAVDAQNRTTHYDRLKQDTRAQESLSRFGKIALAFYTWPVSSMNINPFASNGTGADGLAAKGGATQNPFANGAQAGTPKQDMDQYTLVQVEFNRGELQGPDIEHGYRAYKDTLADRDGNAVHDWLERLQDHRERTATEAQYIWQHLATKELEFYRLEEDDNEKDIVRREIQLLNTIASDYASRDAIFSFHIADARKRLEQMETKDSIGQNLLPASFAVQVELPADWKEYHNPQLVAETLRLNWTRQKALLSFLEHSTSLHGEFQPEAGTPQETHLKQIRENADAMKKNVEATERLLKELENQVRRAEEHVKKL